MVVGLLELVDIVVDVEHAVVGVVVDDAVVADVEVDVVLVDIEDFLHGVVVVEDFAVFF